MLASTPSGPTAGYARRTRGSSSESILDAHFGAARHFARLVGMQRRVLNRERRPDETNLGEDRRPDREASVHPPSERAAEARRRPERRFRRGARRRPAAERAHLAADAGAELDDRRPDVAAAEPRGE